VEKMRSVVKQDYEDFETIYRSHRAGYDSGHKTATEYWTGVLKHFAIEPAETTIDALIQEDVKSWTRIHDSMIQFVEEIRTRTCKLAIISNMTEETLVCMRATFDWLNFFDELIFSCEIGTNKPDRKIYEVCLDKLRLSPGNCLFVDDSTENIDGASAVGMHTIQFISTDDFFSAFNRGFQIR